MTISKGGFYIMVNQDQESVRRIISRLKRKDGMEDVVDKDEVSDILRSLNEAYVKGEDIVPDNIYDDLYSLAVEVYPDIAIAGVRSTEEVTEGYQHRFPELRGTLDNVHSIYYSDPVKSPTHKSLEEWLERKGLLGEVKLTLKVDGVSQVIELDMENGNCIRRRALKRGDTKRNLAHRSPILEKDVMMDIYMKYISDIIGYVPTDGPVGLQVEVFMTEENFKRYRRNIKDVVSPRSAVTSILNNYKTEDTDLLTYIGILPIAAAYDGVYYRKDSLHGPYIKEYRMGDYLVADATNLGQIKEKITELQHFSDVHGIPADGVVISSLEDSDMETLGRKDNINQWEIAYKFPAKETLAIIEDVDMSVGNLGSITPVAKVKPVKVNNVTVKSIGLGSVGRYRELGGLAVDDIVIISHGVIPYLEKIHSRSGKKPKQLPEKCEKCKAPLALSGRGNGLTCINENCPLREVGRLTSFCSKLKIEGISYKTVERLYDAGIISDLVSLTLIDSREVEITILPGMGSISATNIIHEVQRALERETYDYELVGALGIPLLGRSIFKKVFAEITLGEFMSYVDSRRVKNVIDSIETNIPVLGTVSKQTLAQWFIDKKHVVELENLIHVFNVKSSTGQKDNKNVCLTGFRDADLTTYLESQGINVVSSFRKTLDAVITPSNETTTGTVKKAHKANIPVLVFDGDMSRITNTILNK